MLNPRAIALQGLGSGVLFVALQGLVPVTETATSPGAGGVFAPRVRIASSVDFRRDDEEVMLILLTALHVMESER